MSFTDFNTYSGDQVILTSDRIVFNTKKDSIFFLSKDTIGFSAAGSFHINVGDTNKTDDNVFIVNSPRIELGLANKGKLQPIAKGDETIKIFDQLLTALSSFSETMKGSVGIGVGTVDLPTIIAASSKLGLDVNNIRKNIDNIKSKTTFSI